MKVFFIGSVEIGFTILKSIYKVTHVDTILTLPLEKENITSGFVNFEPIAKKYNSRLIRTSDTNTIEMVNLIRLENPDLIIVCGWQRLICQEILDIPRLGTIGFHSSLLPKYRGRAPVNWAIIMGEKETGITMFYLTPEADDGDIIAQKSFPILLNDDCNTIYKKSALAGAELIKEYLPKIQNNSIQRIHNQSASFPAYPKRTPKDGLIDFNRSALDVYNFIRALTKPYPGAYYFDENGNKVIVWKCAIVMDDSELKDNDILFSTLDFKIKILEMEKL
jgi:methionyl-tRNA formyltransferase